MIRFLKEYNPLLLIILVTTILITIIFNNLDIHQNLRLAIGISAYILSSLLIIRFLCKTRSKASTLPATYDSARGEENLYGTLLLDEKAIIEKILSSNRMPSCEKLIGEHISKIFPQLKNFSLKDIDQYNNKRFIPDKNFDNKSELDTFFIEVENNKILCVLYDISAFNKIYDDLILEKQKADAIIEQSPEAVAVFTPDMRIVKANKKVEEITGQDMCSIVNKKCHEVVLGGQEPCEGCKFSALMKTKKPQQAIKYEKNQSGNEYWLHQLWYPIFDKNNNIIFVVEIIRDITELRLTRQALTESENKFKQFMDISPSLVFIIQDMKLKYANQYAQSLINFSDTEYQGINFLTIVDQEYRETVKDHFYSIEKGEDIYDRVDFKIVASTGMKRWVDLSVGIIEYDGKPAFLATAFDITDQKILEESVKYQNFFDPLTKLPNIVLFKDRIKQSIQKQQECDYPNFAVIYFNIDRFKSINNSLGFLAGDTLLQVISDKIKSMLNTDDSMARITADEFSILIDDLSSKEVVDDLLHRLVHTFKDPLTFADEDIHVSFSIGVLYADKSYFDIDTVIHDANTAMFHAKLKGGNSICYYNDELEKTPYSYLKFENDIRNALKRQEFINYYQPIVDLNRGVISGFETLVRWQPKSGEIIYPDEFIPIAENSTLIIPIGNNVMVSALKQLMTWMKEYKDDLKLSINLSSIQFSQPDFIKDMEHLFEEFPCSNNIDLEITESVLMDSASVSVKKLNQLKKLNIKFAIDDFGTGYSSLSYLQQFPVEIVKIDKTFITDINTNEGNQKIVKAIISLAHNLKLKVNAEGIETMAQATLLKEYGCDFGQGFYFARGLPAEEAEALICSNKKWDF